MGLVRPKPELLDPRYFLYNYISPSYQEFIRSRIVQGATVDRIALKEFPTFPITLPSLKEQRLIVETLSVLDERIELNQRMNKTLGELRDSLLPRLMSGQARVGKSDTEIVT